MTSTTIRTRNFDELSFKGKDDVLQIISDVKNGKFEIEYIRQYISFYTCDITNQLNRCFPICSEFALEISTFLKALKKTMKKHEVIEKVNFIFQKDSIDEYNCNKINHFFISYEFCKEISAHSSFCYMHIVVPYFEACNKLQNYLRTIAGLSYYLELLTIAVQMLTDESEEDDSSTRYRIDFIKECVDLNEIYSIRVKLFKQYSEIKEIYKEYLSITSQLRNILNKFDEACRIYVGVIYSSRENKSNETFRRIEGIFKLYPDIIEMINKANEDIVAFSEKNKETEISSKMMNIKIEFHECIVRNMYFTVV